MALFMCLHNSGNIFGSGIVNIVIDETPKEEIIHC
jgi:hypothetical protein